MALSPEEKTLLADIKSNITQLEQLDNEGRMDEEQIMSEMHDDNEEKAEHNEDEDEDENEMEKAENDDDEKDEVEKQDGPTASDDAEDRIEEGKTDVNEITVDDVQKTLNLLLRRLGSSKAVVKSKKSKNNSELIGLTNVVKSLSNQYNVVRKEQQQVSRAVVNILDGLNLADEIQKFQNKKVQKNQKIPEIYMPDESLKVLKSIETAIKGNNAKESSNDNITDIRKSLRDILPHIAVKK